MRWPCAETIAINYSLQPTGDMTFGSFSLVILGMRNPEVRMIFNRFVQPKLQEKDSESYVVKSRVFGSEGD